jgi:hypothetical protein
MDDVSVYQWDGLAGPRNLHGPTVRTGEQPPPFQALQVTPGGHCRAETHLAYLAYRYDAALLQHAKNR